MSKIKYRIKEYEECVHDYKRDESNRIVMEVASIRKAYHPEIHYGGLWDSWQYLTEYSYQTEAEALQKIENHKKKTSIEASKKVRYINVD